MDITQELLDKYYLGQCSPAEKSAVEEWLAEEDTFTALPAHLDLQALEDRQWRHFSNKLPQPFKQPLLKQLWPIWSAAASCLLIFFGLRYFTHEQQQPVREPISYTEVSTKIGQKAKFQLPDGTSVHLNAGSTLRYPRHFEANQRTVYLSGEAYFDVATESKRPFSVYSSQTVTQILGTQFNLRAYPDEQEVTIVVTEGKVNFSPLHGPTSITLENGQLGRYQGEKLSRQEHFSPVDYTAWKQDQIVFRDKALGVIIRDLERWFGVQIQLKDPALAKEHYTGQFQHPRLQQVLKSIGVAVPIRYTINHHQVIIRKSP